MPTRSSSASSTNSGKCAISVSTLVNAARMPSGSALVSIAISPTGVAKRSTPVPSRSAMAIAAATVAWPQNGTSAIGEKNRTVRAPSASPVMNAVSA